ncbi:MAG: hypothetical protein COB29_01080 [Sulfitobacter sp.]|nr:MAG: hypothetical protein COB29_01080 [Sulfitobacter sp.]
MKKKIGDVAAIFRKATGVDPRTFSPKGYTAGTLAKTFKGMDRLIPSSKRERRALTIPHLRILTNYIQSPAFFCDDYTRILLSALLTLGVHSLLRPSEFLSPSTTTHDPIQHLCNSDVTLFTQHIEIFIGKSKTNKKGALLHPILPTGSDPCPYLSLRLYLQSQRRRPPSAPVFVHVDGKYVTRSWLDRALKELCERNNMGSGWSPYSLRRGGCTSLNHIGADPHYIKRAGRWRSNAFEIYTESFSHTQHRNIALSLGQLK